MTLSKHILIGAITATLSMAAMSGLPSLAQSDQPDQHHSMSAEDRAALLDARIAALKAGLKLTPDQEKNWAPLEAAIREQANERAERMAAWRERSEDREKRNLIDRLEMRSQWMTQRAADLQKLIEAVKPLYDTLDDGQKRRFAELMRPSGGGFRQHWRRDG